MILSFSLTLKVGLVLLGLLLIRTGLRYAKARRNDAKIAEAHGCQPLKPWNAKWPLGLDLLVKAFKYESKQQILQFFLDVVGESGNTFEQNLLFARGVDTIDPENIKAVLSTQFEDFNLGLRPPTFDPLMGSGIFTQDGSQWQHSRTLLRYQFSSNRFNNFESIKGAVGHLLRSIPDNGEVDLQPLFFRLTFETTLFLLFGKHLPSLESQDIGSRESEFADAFNLGQDYLAQRGRLGDLYWLLGGEKFRKACRTCHEFVDGAVKTALDSSEKNSEGSSEEDSYIFIDALINETRDPKVLRDQCLNILLAGRDTTACCLTWAMRLLVLHPETLYKLRSEIKGAFGVGSQASEPDINAVKNLPYLSDVLKEVLRLYPSVPVNSRAAVKTTTLPTGGGPDLKSPVLIRKGEAVGYCVYAMHRRTDLYGEDAHLFRPERWENNALGEIGWGYLPFNGGPRVCLGQEFALLEAKYTLIRLLQTYEFLEPVEGKMSSLKDVAVGKERQVLTLVVSSGEGCWVEMTKYPS